MRFNSGINLSSLLFCIFLRNCFSFLKSAKTIRKNAIIIGHEVGTLVTMAVHCGGIVQEGADSVERKVGEIFEYQIKTSARLQENEKIIVPSKHIGGNSIWLNYNYNVSGMGNLLILAGFVLLFLEHFHD